MKTKTHEAPEMGPGWIERLEKIFDKMNGSDELRCQYQQQYEMAERIAKRPAHQGKMIRIIHPRDQAQVVDIYLGGFR